MPYRRLSLNPVDATQTGFFCYHFVPTSGLLVTI